MSPLWRLAVAAAIALGALYYYDGERVEVNQSGQDPTATLSPEIWHGRQFTASTVPSIKNVVADYREHPLNNEGSCKSEIMLWLGNSQLHFINQFRAGDHNAPYWLRRDLKCPDTSVPLGISLPNSNFQELYLLQEYVTARMPVKAIFIELCFDSLRQDNLRQDFAGLANASDRAVLGRQLIGRQMLSQADALWKGQSAGAENPGLSGFAQRSVENEVDTNLGKIWPLWRARDNLNRLLLVDLYLLRNRMLGINPSTVRKLIPARYNRNMQALEAMLQLAKVNHIMVVGYISPIRHDLPIPYDAAEYAAWKNTVAGLFPKYGARYIDLESIVPPEEWGLFNVTGGLFDITGGAIDFVHFRNRGHELVASALLPYARAAEQGDH